jgi:hypothetical protein
MSSTTEPTKVEQAATDEVFKEEPVVPVAPEPAVVANPPAPLEAEPPTLAPLPGQPTAVPSLHGDYVRELQEEFEEQEEEGKVGRQRPPVE